MRGGSTSSSSSSPQGTSGIMLGLVIFTLGELAVWLICMFQQIATTHDTVVGLLQGGTLVPTSMSGQQVIAFLQSNMDKFNRIGYTVAFVTQIIFLGAAMPGSPIHNERLKRIVAILFFVLEVTSDLWYASATGTTVSGAFTWVLNINAGGWLAALMYITAMAAGSTLVGIDAFNRLGQIFAAAIRK